MSEAERDREAKRWLRYAREDLAVAETLARQGDARPRHISWNCQQAVEKALKAILVFTNSRVPRTHDLDALRDVIPQGWVIKQEQPDLAELTEGATSARYPGDWPAPTRAEASRALRQARAVLDAVARDLQAHGLRARGRP